MNWKTHNKILLEQIRRNDFTALGKLFSEKREQWIRSLRARCQCSMDEAEDSIQEAITIFMYNLRQKPNLELEKPAENYIFVIAKRKIIAAKKKDSRHQELPQESLKTSLFEDDPDVFKGMNEEEIQTVLKKLFSMVSEHCKNLLIAYFYQGLSIEQITVEMGYRNKATTSQQLYKCKESAKKALKKLFKNHGGIL